MIDFCSARWRITSHARTSTSASAIVGMMVLSCSTSAGSGRQWAQTAVRTRNAVLIASRLISMRSAYRNSPQRGCLSGLHPSSGMDSALLLNLAPCPSRLGVPRLLDAVRGGGSAPFLPITVSGRSRQSSASLRYFRPSRQNQQRYLPIQQAGRRRSGTSSLLTKLGPRFTIIVWRLNYRKMC